MTAASCTTNCLAPVVKAVPEGIGIRRGSITTIHDVTNTRTIADRPAKDMRRARSALLNLIPTTTGPATAEDGLRGIPGYETRPPVPPDLVSGSRSAIVDAACTMVVNGTQVEVCAFYDNECGDACRLAGIARMVVRGRVS